MADNYIEKQYEQYEARKAAWERERKLGKKKVYASASDKPKQSGEEVAEDMNKKKRVLVTGGAAGIGKAIVQAFCDAGCQVAFCDINEIAGQQTAQETGAVFYKVDVSDKEALEDCMQQLFAEWGDLDVLINNVGISEFAPITKTSVEEFAASKGGLYSLTHALALSLSPWHITVNSIAPGWIQTHDYATLRKEDHTQHPSGRVGKPEDIARMCLFLCREENDFINGENITIDGGMTKKMIYIE